MLKKLGWNLIGNHDTMITLSEILMTGTGLQPILKTTWEDGTKIDIIMMPIHCRNAKSCGSLTTAKVSHGVTTRETQDFASLQNIKA